MKYFKVEAQGDVLYIEAENQPDAEIVLEKHTGGAIPSELLTWTELKYGEPIGVEILRFDIEQVLPGEADAPKSNL